LSNKPALANSGVPELNASDEPPPCRSNVPLEALLNNTPGLLKTTCPAVQAPAPPLTSVPPLNDLVPPLSVIPPLANTIWDDATLPKEPPVQENGPDTVIAMVP